MSKKIYLFRFYITDTNTLRKIILGMLKELTQKCRKKLYLYLSWNIMMDSHSEMQKAYINVCLFNTFENKYLSIIRGGFTCYCSHMGLTPFVTWVLWIQPRFLSLGTSLPSKNSLENSPVSHHCFSCSYPF